MSRSSASACAQNAVHAAFARHATTPAPPSNNSSEPAIPASTRRPRVVDGSTPRHRLGRAGARTRRERPMPSHPPARCAGGEPRREPAFAQRRSSRASGPASSRTMPSPADVPFHPAWWAPTGLLQTVAGMRASGPVPAFRTETVATPDDDSVQVHHVAAVSPDAPRVLLLHGLEGSRHSPYVRAAARHAAAAGLALTVLEFRSCGGRLNLARRTYHSGETTDLALVVAAFAARAPHTPLLLLGFSLGANVLLKWLGEVGARAPAQVRAAVAISPP